MTINCSPETLTLFNAYRRYLAKNNGNKNKEHLSHEETLSYLLTHSTIYPQVDDFIKTEEKFFMNKEKVTK